MNNDEGIHLKTSSDNNISNNNVFLNKQFGFYLDSSFDNRIYNNNIIDNKNQAYDSRDDNLWNESYPTGGNYWSDFDEPNEGAFDNYFGIDQNILDGDGVVDRGFGAGGGMNPYVIDPDSQDNYPLISPGGNYLFLYEGWNLISIPFIQLETDIDSVFSSIQGSYDDVRCYDASNNKDLWKQYHTEKPSSTNDLNDLDHTMGIWIHVIEPGGVLFEYFGIKSKVSQKIQLYKGWNHVGFPSLGNFNRTNGLNNIIFGNQINKILWYDASSDTWYSMNENDVFRKGTGYWIHAKENIVWWIPL
jgi:parallel beta-helix repeat protein